MAKIKYSALVQEMRNKLNGSVMSKNRAGNYVRNKTTPTNPQTSFQQNQRSRLSAVSSSWRGLTDAQRQGFLNLAEQHPYVDIFGDQRKLDGKSMFSKLNLNLLSAGQSAITDAVPFVPVPFVEVLSADVGQDSGAWDSILLTISEATIPAGFTAVIQATPPLPATVNFVKNQFRELGTASASSGEIDVTTLYGARFGAYNPSYLGMRVHFRVFLVSNTTGQAGIASENAGLVVNI